MAGPRQRRRKAGGGFRYRGRVFDDPDLFVVIDSCISGGVGIKRSGLSGGARTRRRPSPASPRTTIRGSAPSPAVRETGD